MMDDQQKAPATPAGPSPAPASAPQPGPKSAPRKPGVSKGAIVTAIAAIVIVMAVAWFKDNIVAYKMMKPWDKAAPCAFVVRVSDAVKSGDVQAAKAALGGDTAVVQTEGGRITKIKPAMASPMQPPLDASVARLAEAPTPKDVEFHMKAFSSFVIVRGKAESGRALEFILEKTVKGEWGVRNMGYAD